MKKIALTLSVLFFVVFKQGLCVAQTSSPAVVYMEDLTKSFNQLKDETWQYLKAITRGKGAKKIENSRQSLISEIDVVKLQVKGKKAFNGDESLKSAVLGYLDLSSIVLKEDFDKILDLEEIAEQSYDLMEAYILAQEKANEKLNRAFDDVQEAQEIFAQNNNITLVEGEQDELSKKIKSANEALGYYNDIYLIFFKSYKQEAYVLEAQRSNDINSLEQNINSMTSIVNEGFEKLKEMENFKGDANLKVAAKIMLTFYKKEAEKEFPKMVDFFIKKEDLERVKKMVEAKKEKDRTQEDVDRYNKSVQDYNKAIPGFNKSIETTNSQRNMYLKQWNSKVELFFDKHTK